MKKVSFRCQVDLSAGGRFPAPTPGLHKDWQARVLDACATVSAGSDGIGVAEFVCLSSKASTEYSQMTYLDSKTPYLMQDTAPGKKYQLRRMILINVGTNKKVPSNRITQIDPRGGASVVGPNGVGKTTTLRLIPLFFGYQPSQLISSTSGQDAMVQFVLPTDVSAIAFEYQRGSNSDEDLRLAVMRREPTDSNVPFYRIYKSGFRKEFFVNEGRFLSDAETQLQISSLGVETTGKLNSSEYRTVVLKTPSVSKNRDKLIRWSHTLMLPLFCGVLSSLLTRPFCAVPRTSVARIAWG